MPSSPHKMHQHITDQYMLGMVLVGFEKCLLLNASVAVAVTAIGIYKMRYREILESCWQGYRQQGMKKKGDRIVPNCVKMTEDELEENLRKWFKEKWVRFNPQGKIMGPCARGSSKEGKPKCLPQAKAHALGKKGRASAAARKRRQDPNPERKGAAINVATKKK